MKINAEKLRIVMSDCQMGTKELATVTGICESTIKRAYRGGEMRSTTIGKIAAALGVPAESLILDEKAEQKKAEAERSELLLKYAELSEKQQELSEKGLTFAADMLGKELKAIQEKLG
ncbi:MAG: helix-turn-helix transcriptional regulator [Lachnospiraceae bacterium]|nr:helix-turn-helix transcriptional regulator [Lachnospiraceae bacterium]